MKKIDTNVSKDTKQLILAVSLHLFSQRGFKGATMRDIADQADVSLGLAYTYFGSKEEILSSLLLEFVEGRRRLFQQILEETDPQTHNSIDIIRLMTQDISKHKEEFRLYAQLMLQPQTSKKLASVKRSLQKFHQEEAVFVKRVNDKFGAKQKIPAELFKVVITGMMFLKLHREDFDINSALDMLANNFVHQKRL